MKPLLLLPALLLLSPLSSNTSLANGIFQLNATQIQIPENGAAAGLILTTDFNAFTFIPPFEWRYRAIPSEKKIQFWNSEMETSFTFKILEQNLPHPPKLNQPTERSQILQKHPQMRLQEEFFCYSSGFTGLGFILRSEKPGPLRSLRLAILPFENGTIELTLAFPGPPNDEHHQLWTSLVHSLEIQKRTQARPRN